MTPANGLTRYKHGPDEDGTPGRGCRCGRCGEANNAWQRHRYRMAAYGRDSLASAAGTQRRLQALMRCGWSLGLLSARLGQSRQVLRLTLHRSERVTAATARAVRELYDELWDQPPPEGNRFERRAATMARQYARERGWPLPAAWDDDEIDDPAAAPAEGWERRDGVRRWGVLAEDAAHLLAAGEEPEWVAERLGVSPKTLGTVLMRERKRAEAMGCRPDAGEVRDSRVA
jgi:lambda repressor-like predicted transcriptional regulator